jgi:hypothetical protein
MANKGHDTDLGKVKFLLTIVRNSCMEGLDGTWDCTTDEGKEGFLPMAEDIEKAARELGIDLPPYYPNNEDEVA